MKIEQTYSCLICDRIRNDVQGGICGVCRAEFVQAEVEELLQSAKPNYVEQWLGMTGKQESED